MIRIKDMDFDQKLIYVRGKDRSTLLPESIHDAVKNQMKAVEALHDEDLANGDGEVYLPNSFQENTRQRQGNIDGNTCFPPKNSATIPAAEKSGQSGCR